MAKNELENYRGNLSKRGSAAKAAKAADEQYQALEGGEELLLPAIEMDSGPLMDRGEEFMDMMTGYLINNTDGHKGDDAYSSMKRQADGYMKDAHVVEAADQDYSLFAPTANAALRALGRMMTMQALLPVVRDDANGSFGAAVEKHEKGLGKALKKSRPEVGEVSSAMSALEDAAGAARSSAAELRSVIAMEVIHKLHDQLEEKRDEQQDILKAEAKAKKVMGLVTSLVGKIPGVGQALEVTQGLTEKAVGEAPAPDRELGEGVVDGLRIVELEMDGLLTKIGAYGLKAEADHIQGVREAFRTAIHHYEKAWDDVHAAVADQRSAYAKLGDDADSAEVVKGKHGKKGKKKDDDATQVMLYMSAVRETNLFVQTARKEGIQASNALYDARDSIENHTSWGFEQQATYDDGLSGVYKSESPPAVFKKIKQALGLSRGWLEMSKETAEQLEDQEKDAEAAMASIDQAGQY